MEKFPCFSNLGIIEPVKQISKPIIQEMKQRFDVFLHTQYFHLLHDHCVILGGQLFLLLGWGFQRIDILPTEYWRWYKVFDLP